MAAGILHSFVSAYSPVQLFSRPHKTILHSRKACADSRWRGMFANRWFTSIDANRSSRMTRPKCAR